MGLGFSAFRILAGLGLGIHGTSSALSVLGFKAFRVVGLEG